MSLEEIYRTLTDKLFREKTEKRVGVYNLGVYTLGVYSLGVYTLGVDLTEYKHSLVSRRNI